MKKNYLKRMMALAMVFVFILASADVGVFAAGSEYKISVSTREAHKKGEQSIEEEYRNLIKEIVATASDKMTSIYPKTFGHLKGSGITLGLIGENSENSGNNASVNTTVASNKSPKKEVQLHYSLEVNMINFRWPGGTMTDENRKKFIGTISHETMHAMMMEALSAGMTGHKVNAERSGGRFPNWFIEGTAVVSGGGTDFVDHLIEYTSRKLINGSSVEGKHINDVTLTKEDIKNAISEASLVLGRKSSSKTKNIYASYGAGYLACMYLGDLIADEDGDISDREPDVVKVRSGLDTLMSEIANGYSLDLAIKNLSHGKYNGLTDFEENSLDELADYSFKLIEQIKDGKGSVLNDLNSDKVLDTLYMDSEPTIIINDEYTRMYNSYPAGHIVIKGGDRFNTGYSYKGTYPADAPAPEVKVLKEVVDVEVDVKAGKITGLVDGVYQINGKEVKPDDFAKLDIADEYWGKTIEIVKKGHSYSKDSEIFYLEVPKKKLNEPDTGKDSSESDTSNGSKKDEDDKESTVPEKKTSDAATKVDTKNKIEDTTEDKPKDEIGSGGSQSGDSSSDASSGGLSGGSGESNLSGGSSGGSSSSGLSGGSSSLSPSKTKEETKKDEKKKEKKPVDKKKDELKKEEKKETISLEKAEKLTVKDIEELDAKTVENLDKVVLSKLNSKLEENYPDNVVAGARVFKDTKKDDWYAESVKFAVENKVMLGTSKDSFNPLLDTTRGMIATILFRLSKDEKVDDTSSFRDVKKGDWYYEAAAWAKSKNITSGVGENAFSPNAKLTREQLVTLLYRYAQYKEYDTRQSKSLDEYADLEDLSDFSVAPMKWAVETGIISGTSKNSLSAKKGATRAEMATILMRFMEKFAK